MKLTVIMMIIFAAVFVCVGWLAGGVITPVFTGIGAVFSTFALIIAVKRKEKRQ